MFESTQSSQSIAVERFIRGTRLNVGVLGLLLSRVLCEDDDEDDDDDSDVDDDFMELFRSFIAAFPISVARTVDIVFLRMRPFGFSMPFIWPYECVWEDGMVDDDDVECTDAVSSSSLRLLEAEKEIV